MLAADGIPMRLTGWFGISDCSGYDLYVVRCRVQCRTTEEFRRISATSDFGSEQLTLGIIIGVDSSSSHFILSCCSSLKSGAF